MVFGGGRFWVGAAAWVCAVLSAAAAGCFVRVPSFVRESPTVALPLPGKTSPKTAELMRARLQQQERELAVLHVSLRQKRKNLLEKQAEHRAAQERQREAETALAVAKKLFDEAQLAAAAAGKQANAVLQANQSTTLSLQLLQQLVKNRSQQQDPKDADLLKQLTTARKAILASEAARRAAVGQAGEALDRLRQARSHLESAEAGVASRRVETARAEAEMKRAQAERALEAVRKETVAKSVAALRASLRLVDSEQTYTEVFRKCTAAIDSLSKKVDWAQNTELRLKTVFGAVTGGVATVGSALTGVVSSNEDAEAKWYRRPSLWVGVTTAVLTTAGTIITLSSSPKYQSRINRHSRKIKRIKERLAALGWLVGYAPSSWTVRDNQKWTSTVAQLRTLCP